MKTIVFILLLGINLSYNPQAALNYASKYCSSYNQQYNNYRNLGGDCANFVSQCMSAGGQSFSGCAGIDNKGMVPGEANLQICLQSKGWKKYETQPKSFKAGYPIFMKAYRHAMLATGFSGNNIKFSAHTDDHCDANIPASYVYFYSK